MLFLVGVHILLMLGIVAGDTASCGQGCKNNECFPDGRCKDGCWPGYVGDNCDTCSGTYFWNDEYQQCHSCPRLCFTCTSLDNCTECVSEKSYGSACEKVCSHGCAGETCDKDTGYCTCKDTFSGDECNTCADGYYTMGYTCIKCPESCEICRSLPDGHFVCDSCKLGFYGDRCLLECPRGCWGDACTMEGRCVNGCKSEFEGDDCDICVAGKWGTDCSQSCADNCIHCIDEFECSLCKTGFYGDGCRLICSAGCKGGCDITTGVCSTCKHGYSGDICCVNNGNCITCNSRSECGECVEGFYGTECDIGCPQNCKNCTAIDKCGACMVGYLSDDCSERCPENCVSCESSSKCLECKVGYFGETCENACGKSCHNNTCEKTSGHCLLGCLKGYQGKTCDETSDGVRCSVFIEVYIMAMFFLVSAT